MSNFNVARAYDAICETVGRTNTASESIRNALGDYDIIGLSTLATMIHQQARTKELRNARLAVLRTITKRQCKLLEITPLTYRLNKQLDLYECVELEEKEKVEVDPVLEALALVLDNLDRDDVLAAIKAALVG